MRDEELAAEGHESGYYELALSNRQLIAAFCLFSVVLAGAFLMGVWFAREGQALGPSRPEAPRTASLSDQPLAEPAATGTLDEMKFFSEEKAAPPPVRPAPRPAPPASEPAPPALSAAPSTPSPQVAPPGPGAALHVQVFSSPDLPQARKVLDQLKRAGYPAALSPIEVGSKTMHRVRVGPYRERAEAERVAEQVKAKFRLATWITSY